MPFCAVRGKTCTAFLFFTRPPDLGGRKPPWKAVVEDRGGLGIASAGAMAGASADLCGDKEVGLDGVGRMLAWGILTPIAL